MLTRSYYDGQSNDSRLNTVINRTAIDAGAVSLNYMEVVDLLHAPCEQHAQSHPHERISGVVLHDRLTHEEVKVQGKVVVNATGPFVDAIMTMHEKIRFPERTTPHQNVVVPAKGVHLLLRGDFCPNSAGIVTTTSDNRVMFMLPWQN